MKYTLANIAFFLGAIGFISILFLIIAGALGCCANISGDAFQKITLGVFILGAAATVGCVVRNCYYHKHQQQ